MVAVHWTRTATHSGEGLGFSATGRTIAFGGTLFVRVEAGKLAESWNYVDQAGMLQQLGRPDLPRAL
jgi:predicted ester cyclase